MKTLERCQWRRPIVYIVNIVNCEHISNFLLIIDFEQPKVCWVYIEKIWRQDQVYQVLCCSNLSVTKIF